MSEDALVAKVFTGIKKKRKKYLNRIDLVGRRFGRLIVTEFDHESEDYSSWWRCQCDCGNEKIIVRRHLISGNTNSCGCLKKELQTIHGMYKTPEYRTWIRIKTRCENENTPYYADYGGRGIKVCERWRESFDKFYADMGNRPSKNHSIDRKNVNGDYSPENCRWATRKEQQQNIRIQKSNTSGVNGVSWHTKIKRYVASITVNGQGKYIGCFKELTDAAEARRQAEIKYWGR